MVWRIVCLVIRINFITFAALISLEHCNGTILLCLYGMKNDNDAKHLTCIAHCNFAYVVADDFGW